MLEKAITQNIGGEYARSIMREVEKSGWTESARRKIDYSRRMKLTSSGSYELQPKKKAKPVKTLKGEAYWSSLAKQLNGGSRRRSDRGPTRGGMDPYTRQIYNEQRRTNKINNQNQQQLVGLNSRLGQLGLIGA